MNKFKNFLHNLFIKSKFIKEFGVFLLGMSIIIPVMFTMFYIIGYVTVELIGVDLAKQNISYIEKILSNGAGVGIILMMGLALLLVAYSFIRFVIKAWKNA